MANGDIEASQSRTTQAKANINGNPTETRQSRTQIYSRASMVNEGSGQIETSIRQESWLVDEDQWEIISPSVDMETSISSGEFEDDDVPLLRSPGSMVVKEEQEDMEKSVSLENLKMMMFPCHAADQGVGPPRSRAVKEEEDYSRELASSKPSSFDEGTSSSLCAHMKKTISFHSGGYEEDDVSLSVSMIEGSLDQGQASVSQDSEKDANTHLATSAPPSDDKENGHHDHRIDCQELRVDTGKISGGFVDSEEVDVSLLPKVDRIEAESRITNTELGDREPKSRSRSSIITRSMSSEASGDMHPNNLHLDDFYLGTCGHCECALAPHHHT
ncbi:hypothetical protein L6164_023498 [Bauhinia variegata]|uniref:Uncharacterized protein n=1 Tax=Bauhinia variegata TaxID=167791 RepID=A0ACB9MJA0_BAUVA|nr:hypothetical protein L6164_023498 [Bauhinia variegata]